MRPDDLRFATTTRRRWVDVQSRIIEAGVSQVVHCASCRAAECPHRWQAMIALCRPDYFAVQGVCHVCCPFSGLADSQNNAIPQGPNEIRNMSTASMLYVFALYLLRVQHATGALFRAPVCDALHHRRRVSEATVDHRRMVDNHQSKIPR